MEHLKYKRLNPGVEILTILIITVAFFSGSIDSEDKIALLAVMLFIYLLLTTISWFSNGPGILLKPVRMPALYGEKTNISEEEKLYHINRSVVYSGLFKLIILLLPFFIISFTELPALGLLVLICLIILLTLSAALFFMTLSVRSILSAHGYQSLTFKEVLLKGVLYYNEEDKNSVIDKPFGYGQTINLASKEGRIILYVILGFPLLMMIILFIILSSA